MVPELILAITALLMMYALIISNILPLFILLLVHPLWQLKMEVLYDSRDSVNIVHCKYYGAVILMDPWTMESCCNFENNGFGNIGIRRTNGDIFGLDVMS